MTLLPAAPVGEILLEDGRAAGVRLEDGTEFYADKLVASSVDLEQTFGKMLPAGAVPKETQEDVESYKYQDGSLFTVHMAMHKVPTYKAAAFDPDINQAWVLNIGYECLEDYNEDWAAIRKGEVPEEPRLNVAINSMFDPTDAPEGKATGMIRVFAPYSVDNKGPGVWSTSFKDVYAQKCVDKMLEHCDGFKQEDIWVQRPYTPLDISEKLVNMVERRLDGGQHFGVEPHAQSAQPGPLSVPDTGQGLVSLWFHDSSARVHHLRAGLQRPAGDRRGL